MSSRKAIEVSDKAIEQVVALLAKRDKESLGVRVGVKSGGCSGLKYFVEYADEINKYDEVVKAGGVTILIDPKALMYLIGTRMDYIEEQFKSGFVFINPNEKSKCGCGSSFSV